MVNNDELVVQISDIQPGWTDYPNNDGQCVLVFMHGCTHDCPGCQNVELQVVTGYNETISGLIKRINVACGVYRTNKVVLTGGDPLCGVNLGVTSELLNRLQQDVMVYTGYDVDFVKESGIFGFTYLKCGLFDVNKMVATEISGDYMQFASTNQALYDGNWKKLTDNGRYTY